MKRKLAILNVKTVYLYQSVKLDNIKQEARKFDIDMLGIAETRWTGCK